MQQANGLKDWLIVFARAILLAGLLVFWGAVGWAMCVVWEVSCG